MSIAVNDQNSVIRRIGKSDDIGENYQVSTIPPRKVTCSGIFVAAPDSHNVKVNFMAFLYSVGLVEKDKLVRNRQRV